MIFEEFFNFLFQNLFINIDDSNGQSNCRAKKCLVKHEESQFHELQ